MNDDVLIIGGGIAGISAAAALAPHAAVTLLEAEDMPGYHASGRSAAMFLADYGNAVVRALNRASIDHLENADGGVLSPRGMMLLGRECDAADFQTESKSFDMDKISIDKARDYLPILNRDSCAHAAFRADVFDLDADRLLQNYAKAARKYGAEIMTGARVETIRRTAAGWDVDTSSGGYSAALIVNAAGAWVDEIARLAGIAPLGFQAYRRSMALLPAPGGLETRNWPFCLAVKERWYAKPDAGKLIVSPSDEDPAEPHDAWADDMVLAQGLARYEEMVTEPVTRLESSWAGLRTFAPDRALVIGPDVSDPAFFWLGGQGGYGFQTAPAASRLLADLVLGRAPELDSGTTAALSPRRLS